MKNRPLGATGLSVSEIGLGGVSFPSMKDYPACEKVIRRAIDLGVNFIDTAPGYKESEEIIGKALAGGARKSVILSTKYYPYEADSVSLDPKRLVASVERSLSRLGTDHLDMLHFHWVHDSKDVNAILSSPLREALAGLRKSGKVRHAAVSEASEMDGRHEMLESALTHPAVESAMVTYNAFLQTAERSVFPLAEANRKGIVVMMPLNQPLDGKSGLLGPSQALENVRRLIEKGALPDSEAYRDPGIVDFITADRPDLSMPQAAIRFVLDRREVSSVLVGTRSLRHLEENLRASEAPPLSAETHQKLSALFSGIETHVK